MVSMKKPSKISQRRRGRRKIEMAKIIMASYGNRPRGISALRSWRAKMKWRGGVEAWKIENKVTISVCNAALALLRAACHHPRKRKEGREKGKGKEKRRMEKEMKENGNRRKRKKSRKQACPHATTSSSSCPTISLSFYLSLSALAMAAAAPVSAAPGALHAPASVACLLLPFLRMRRLCCRAVAGAYAFCRIAPLRHALAPGGVIVKAVRRAGEKAMKRRMRGNLWESE